MIEGRRAQGRARYPAYYAQHPESSDKKLRRKGQHQFELHLEDGVVITMRIIDATSGRLGYRVPKGVAMFATHVVFAQGAQLILQPSERLRAAIPGMGSQRVTVVSCGVLAPGRKTGNITVEGLDPDVAQRVLLNT
jgi:hypothetical protein